MIHVALYYICEEQSLTERKIISKYACICMYVYFCTKVVAKQFNRIKYISVLADLTGYQMVYLSTSLPIDTGCARIFSALACEMTFCRQKIQADK